MGLTEDSFLLGLATVFCNAVFSDWLPSREAVGITAAPSVIRSLGLPACRCVCSVLHSGPDG